MKDKEEDQKTRPIEITLYTAEWCQACQIWVPKILEKAEESAIKVNLIKTDSDDPEVKRRSSHVLWIPHIEFNNHEISYEEFLTLADKQKCINNYKKKEKK